MRALSKIAFLLYCCFCLIDNSAYSQTLVSGKVFESTGMYPLEAVSVLTTSGKGTVTNFHGAYSLTVRDNDSIWFSYLGKATMKFPVKEIFNLRAFDISLQTSTTVLKEVKVYPSNYRYDSIQNRTDYDRAFEYKKPTIGSIITSVSITGITVDIDELIRAFQYRKKRNMLAFQRRLILQEHDKYVDHRFTKALVRRLTGLDSCELEPFMLATRPAYEFVLTSSDYDLRNYILTSYEHYKMAREHVKKED